MDDIIDDGSIVRTSGFITSTTTTTGSLTGLSDGTCQINYPSSSISLDIPLHRTYIARIGINQTRFKDQFELNAHHNEKIKGMKGVISRTTMSTCPIQVDRKCCDRPLVHVIPVHKLLNKHQANEVTYLLNEVTYLLKKKDFLNSTDQTFLMSVCKYHQHLPWSEYYEISPHSTVLVSTESLANPMKIITQHIFFIDHQTIDPYSELNQMLRKLIRQQQYPLIHRILSAVIPFETLVEMMMIYCCEYYAVDTVLFLSQLID
jgi:hypothetical protein